MMMDYWMACSVCGATWCGEPEPAHGCGDDEAWCGYHGDTLDACCDLAAFEDMPAEAWS